MRVSDPSPGWAPPAIRGGRVPGYTGQGEGKSGCNCRQRLCAVSRDSSILPGVPPRRKIRDRTPSSDRPPYRPQRALPEVVCLEGVRSGCPNARSSGGVCIRAARWEHGFRPFRSTRRSGLETTHVPSGTTWTVGITGFSASRGARLSTLMHQGCEPSPRMLRPPHAGSGTCIRGGDGEHRLPLLETSQAAKALLHPSTKSDH